MSLLKKMGTVAGFLFLSIGSANALPITLNAIDRGWYKADGTHIESNENTSTKAGAYSSWFLFDLSGLSGSFSAATLRLEMEAWFQDPAKDSTGNVSIWDVNTDLSVLVASHSAPEGEVNTEGQNIYTDLESGTMYSSNTVSSTDVGSIIEFNLSLDALTDINSSVGGRFALGTQLSDNYLRWSGASEFRVHQLILEPSIAASNASIPEPASLALMALGLAGIGFARKKKTA